MDEYVTQMLDLLRAKREQDEKALQEFAMQLVSLANRRAAHVIAKKTAHWFNGAEHVAGARDAYLAEYTHVLGMLE